jgi:hypothetical protein
MLLLAVIPRTPHTGELLDALYSNAGISGLGLLLTAIVQTAQNSLSLFHALFILHMLFFLGTGASPMGEYSAIVRPLSPHTNTWRVQVNIAGLGAVSPWVFSCSLPR